MKDAESFLAKGQSLLYQYDFDNAWFYLKRALDEFLKLSDFDSYYTAAYYMDIVEKNLGNVYATLYQFKDTGSYFERNLSHKQLGYCRLRFHSFLEIGDLENAYITYCAAVEDIASSRGIDLPYYRGHVMHAEFEMAVGNYGVAIFYLNEALRYFEKFFPSETYLNVSTKCLLAKAWQQNGDIQKAKDYASQAFDKAQGDPTTETALMVDISILCAEIYFDCSRPEKYLEYLKFAKNLLNSIHWCQQRQVEARIFSLKPNF